MTTAKALYGEVLTPTSLIDKMIGLFPKSFMREKGNRWLDPGCGTGNITDRLATSLAASTQKSYSDVLETMIDMIEININHEAGLYERFGDCSINLAFGDFSLATQEREYDAIICNPPFNAGGLVKTPTKSAVDKKLDGRNAWCGFVKKAVSWLKPGGFLCVIIPAIWLKPDKNGMYHFLTQYKIHKMHFMTNTETNRVFNGEAQTPTTYFLLEKRSSDGILSLFCNKEGKYIDYHLMKNAPIPMINIGYVNKAVAAVEKYGVLKIEKTNMPPKNVNFLGINDGYLNVRTARLVGGGAGGGAGGGVIYKTMGRTAMLITEFSDKPCKWYKIPKIILAHKMYGMPFFDREGIYGISNRDNYVVWDYSIEELERIYAILSNPDIIQLYDATRYRMSYLEKYAFEFVALS